MEMGVLGTHHQFLLGFKLRVCFLLFSFVWVFCPLHDGTSYIARVQQQEAPPPAMPGSVPYGKFKFVVVFFTKKIELQCSHQSFFFCGGSGLSHL
jgi:hypothetical protein